MRAWFFSAKPPTERANFIPLTLDRPHLALGVLAAAATSDVADGWYARRFHDATPLGAALDPIMDKAFAFSVLASMLAERKISVLEALLIGTREIGELPLLIRWLTVPRVRRSRERRSANVFGKVATVAQFAAVVAVLAGAPYRQGWISITALCGALAAISYAIKELRVGGDVVDAKQR